MWKFLIFRLLQALPVILVVVTLTFFMVRLAPGGPFSGERNVAPEVERALNARYQLDKPVRVQYLNYLAAVARLDFGPSFRHPGRTVSEIILAGLPVTAELGMYALLVALVVGLSSALVSALKPNSMYDHIARSIALTGICIPAFVLGPLLVLVIGIWLEWLPVSGWGLSPGDKLLPSITLGTAYAAYIARLGRGALLDVLSMDYVRTARAKGLSEFRVVIDHALRVGLLPVVAFMGPAMAGLLSGSFVVESIFQIPGVGRYYVQAAFNRDYTLIMGSTILFSTFIVLFNLLADIIQAYLNPRLRYTLTIRSNEQGI